MDIDIYGDQNNIKYPNKIKLIKLAVEWMKSDDFLYILREKKRAWIHVLVLESVRDFYNFRVNHAQFYVNGNTDLLTVDAPELETNACFLFISKN